MNNLFLTVPQRDYLGFHSHGDVDVKKVAQFLDLSVTDLSRLSNEAVPKKVATGRVPADVRQRITEIASIVNLVAEFFEGDRQKTTTWFHVPNPTLGGIRPRDMVRMGRYAKLLQHILLAKEESGWGSHYQENAV